MTERLIFSTSVEGLLRVLDAHAPHPDTEQRLRGLGFDREHLLPAYPVEQCMKLVDMLGETLFPHLARDARDRAVGEAFIRAYEQTFLGRALFALSRVLGPMRITTRLAQTIRSVNNYTETTVGVRSERDVRVTCTPVTRPHYYCGVLEEGGRLAGNPTYSVLLDAYENETAEFSIRW